MLCWRSWTPRAPSSSVRPLVLESCPTLLTCRSFHEVRIDFTNNSQRQSHRPSHRELYMREAQGFLLVFSITSLSSLLELSELREQIVHVKNDPNVPIVLVGNKSDLEEDRAVSRSRAFAVSQAWGNVPYYETSARRRQNVTEVFVDVCRQIIRRDIARTRALQGGGSGTHAYIGERDTQRDREQRRNQRRRRRSRSRSRQRYDEDDDSRGGRRHGRSRCVIL
jgi:Ras-related protein Rap-1B